jgi:hypothetical protein
MAFPLYSVSLYEVLLKADNRRHSIIYISLFLHLREKNAIGMFLYYIWNTHFPTFSIQIYNIFLMYILK